VPDQADSSEQPLPSFNPYPPDRRRRSWTGCLPPLLWLMGTVGSTVLGCVLGAAHYRQVNGPPNPGLYSEMRIYYEMIANGGLIGAGVGALGGALFWLIFSLVVKDPRGG
jgi:hypothetical protein